MVDLCPSTNVQLVVCRVWPWVFGRGNFEEAVLAAVNLGDDADTTGAVWRQLAGAYWGREGNPDSWRMRLACSVRLESVARGLAAVTL